MKLWCLKILSRQLTRVWNRAFQVHSFVWCLMINKMSVPGKSFSKHKIIIFTFYLYTRTESLVWGLCSNEESFIVVHITNMYGCLLMSVACFCCFTRLSVKGLEQCNLTPSASLTLYADSGCPLTQRIVLLSCTEGNWHKHTPAANNAALILLKDAAAAWIAHTSAI